MKDTTSHFDDVDFTNGDNTNGIVRMAYIKESKVLDLQGPILHDLFQVKHCILNQVGISIKFHRSRPDFCLLSNEAKTYKIDIEEMALRVCKVQVNPAVFTAHNAMLSSTNAKYPYTKTEKASMILAKDTLNFPWNSRFLFQQGLRHFRLQRGDVWWQSYQEPLEFSELQLESNKCECGRGTRQWWTYAD